MMCAKNSRSHRRSINIVTVDNGLIKGGGHERVSGSRAYSRVLHHRIIVHLGSENFIYLFVNGLETEYWV